jgi:hypothetical protein
MGGDYVVTDIVTKQQVSVAYIKNVLRERLFLETQLLYKRVI